jgi:parvulin-like peptidyl-prolyl isomerase
MVEARKNGSLSPLSEVRGTIDNKLVQNERQQQQEKWIASLRKKAYIKMY